MSLHNVACNGFMTVFHYVIQKLNTLVALTILGTLSKALLIELLNLRALEFLPLNKRYFFQCMGKIFCVEFQRVPFLYTIEIFNALRFQSSYTYLIVIESTMTYRLSCCFVLTGGMEGHQIPPSFDTDHYSDVIMSAMASQITSFTIVYSRVYSGTDQRKH